MTNEEIGRALRSYRDEACATLEDIAGVLGISIQSVSFYEHGRRTIPATTLLRFLDAYGITPMEFFGSPVPKRTAGRRRNRKCRRGHEPENYIHTSQRRDGRIVYRRRCIACEREDRERRAAARRKAAVAEYPPVTRLVVAPPPAPTPPGLAHDPDRCDPDTPHLMCNECRAEWDAAQQEAC